MRTARKALLILRRGSGPDEIDAAEFQLTRGAGLRHLVDRRSQDVVAPRVLQRQLDQAERIVPARTLGTLRVIEDFGIGSGREGEGQPGERRCGVEDDADEMPLQGSHGCAAYLNIRRDYRAALADRVYYRVSSAAALDGRRIRGTASRRAEAPARPVPRPASRGKDRRPATSPPAPAIAAPPQRGRGSKSSRRQGRACAPPATACALRARRNSARFQACSGARGRDLGPCLRRRTPQDGVAPP